MTSTIDIIDSRKPDTDGSISTPRLRSHSFADPGQSDNPQTGKSHAVTENASALTAAPVSLEARPAGMPPLSVHYPRMPAFKRYMAEKVFYAPMALVWAALSLRYGSVTLPTAANPTMEAGGLWGESKIQCMSILGPEAANWTAPFIWVRNGDGTPSGQRAALRSAVDAIRSAGLRFPVVAKPDLGYQGWGVRRINSLVALTRYLAAYPPGQKVIIQQLVPYDGEAGIFYVRRPGDARGRIHSMALVYYPHVVGDGASSLEALIDADPWLSRAADEVKAANSARLSATPEKGETVRLTFCGSYRLGAVYRDARHHVTEALTDRIETISRDIPGFHFGRFDIRFRDLDALKRGEDFQILELNGAGAEVLHIWDGATTLPKAYAALIEQYCILFRIAADNRKLGHKPVGIRAMMQRQRRQEELRSAYPPSN